MKKRNERKKEKKNAQFKKEKHSLKKKIEQIKRLFHLFFVIAHHFQIFM